MGAPRTLDRLTQLLSSPRRYLILKSSPLVVVDSSVVATRPVLLQKERTDPPSTSAGRASREMVNSQQIINLADESTRTLRSVVFALVLGEQRDYG